MLLLLDVMLPVALLVKVFAVVFTAFCLVVTIKACDRILVLGFEYNRSDLKVRSVSLGLSDLETGV